MRLRSLVFGLLTTVLSAQTIFAQVERIALQLDHRFPPPDSIPADFYIAHLSDLELIDDDLVAVLDQFQKTLLIVTKSGGLVRQIGRTGEGPGEFTFPWDVEYDSDSGLIWVLDRGRVQAFSRTDFSFSHMIRPTEIRPMDMAAEEGQLFLSHSSYTGRDLVFRYSATGEFLGTLGTHIERQVGDYGRNLYKNGNLASTSLPDGSLVFCYTYTTFNDILLFSQNEQQLVHSDYPPLLVVDRENRKVAPDWSDPDLGPSPYVLVGDPVLTHDRLFLCVRYGTHQKETPILEMDFNGKVQRVWIIPAEYGAPLALAVEMEGNEPIFWIGWSYPEPNVGMMVRDDEGAEDL